MRPIYKSLVLEATTLQISLALNAETRDDESASTMALQAELLDSLRVELVAQGVSGARDLINSGECVIEGSNLTINLDTTNWTEGSMYRVQVLAMFGTQTQVIYALNVAVPRYVVLPDETQEFEDSVTIVSTITDVTEADLEGLALEATSQEIKAAITPIATAAEAYNVGKTQLAAAITSKGVETLPTETYPEMAEKVNAISQETYEINGGDMYAKQLFGSLGTPNYWNLYEVLANLLSDGRLVSYGGILLAEYYKGYDSLALSGAGAGGAYVVSDKDAQGNFIMYTNDTTHTWATEFDGKGNRWVAYCFADEYHDFQITDTNTSPRSIFIGRKVGTITNLANGRHSQLVIPDGNKLRKFNQNSYSNTWQQRVIVRNLEQGVGLFDNATNITSAYVEVDNLNGLCYGRDSYFSLDTLIVKANSAGGVLFPLASSTVVFRYLTTLYLNVQSGSVKLGNGNNGLQLLGLKSIILCGHNFQLGNGDLGNAIPSTAVVYFMYEGAAKDGGSLSFTGNSSDGYNCWKIISDVRIQEGWCKNIDVSLCKALTEANMYTYILQRLKQDEPDCGDGVTITLGATNLAKLTSEESVQLLDDLTNIYGYTFA